MHIIYILQLFKSIDLNMFVVFTDEELDALLDRSDMVDSTSQTISTEYAEHFKVLTSS